MLFHEFIDKGLKLLRHASDQHKLIIVSVSYAGEGLEQLVRGLWIGAQIPDRKDNVFLLKGAVRSLPFCVKAVGNIDYLILVFFLQLIVKYRGLHGYKIRKAHGHALYHTHGSELIEPLKAVFIHIQL